MRVTYIGEGAFGLVTNETYWMSGEMESGGVDMILVNDLWQRKADFVPAAQDSEVPLEKPPAGPRKIPDAWSYSTFNMWEECPKRYEGLKIMKLGDQAGPGMAEGDAFHKQVARYIMDPSAGLPARPIHKDALPVIQGARSLDVPKTVEQQWGITPHWKQTGWFSRDPKKPTWLRVIVDLGMTYEDDTGEVVDWKTGKRYDHNDDQMEVFAAGYFVYRPWLKHVTTRLVYVDTGQEEYAEFPAKDAEKLQEKWSAKAREMLTDREWPARPGFRCKFCPRAKSAGGDCAFG